jgi:hypothetical protein
MVLAANPNPADPIPTLNPHHLVRLYRQRVLDLRLPGLRRGLEHEQMRAIEFVLHPERPGEQPARCEIGVQLGRRVFRVWERAGCEFEFEVSERGSAG